MGMALMPPASGGRSALALGFGDAKYQLGYADVGAGGGVAAASRPRTCAVWEVVD